MAGENAERFMNALTKAEEHHDPEPLVRLFTKDAQIKSTAKRHGENGQDGARHFWGHYLSLFSEIRSRFTNVIEHDDSAVLEWQSQGTLQSGQAIDYAGVSVVEFVGDRVIRFRTYYDPTPFIRPLANGAH